MSAVIPPLDLSHPDVWIDPYPIYRHYRESAPVHFVPQAAGSGSELQAGRYIVTRHADVVAGMRHRGLVRNVRSSQWDETKNAIPVEHLALARTCREWVIFTDPPEHGRLRQPINRVCNGVEVSDFREWVADEAGRVAGGLPAAGVVDVVGEYAAVLTSQLVANLLGLLEGMLTQELDTALTCIQMVMSNRYDRDRLSEASAHMARFCEELEKTICKPVEDRAEAMLLEGLLKEAAVSGLPPHQVRSTAILLLMAARDNVRNTIGSAVLNLLRHPPSWEWLRSNLTPEAAANAVEEVLRFEPPVQFMSRHASEDLEFAGAKIQKGQGVTFCLAAANRDPAVYENPEVFDWRREPGKSAAFGFGIHQCPGDRLARIMIEEALKALLTRWDQPRLAIAQDQLAWQKSMVFRGLAVLPVEI
ncbi:cytochrome P450 [Phragmitibacter flavus]|uniref:Cytochrome P450 n=1 Tax=Phragmitibacter flavus TaxID=2576071 RepID=A0A5R8KFG9_9BACT|nr:cytochrome P450 [Phragmitibacter flavus]TLD71052.1 cytochrome P450 [Phragmitibacter flavus]